jgi:molecular chaperone DnaK
MRGRAEASDDEADARQVRSLVDDLIQRTIEPCKQGAEGCRRQGRREIDEVVLVGGMTRMPKVRRR